jgi:hypothetical protein
MYLCLSGQGQGSVQRGSNEIAAKWARLLLHCNSSDGPLAKDF